MCPMNFNEMLPARLENLATKQEQTYHRIPEKYNQILPVRQKGVIALNFCLKGQPNNEYKKVTNENSTS